MILLAGLYVYHSIERAHAETSFVSAILGDVGQVNVLDREQDHAFMSDMLDRIAPGSEIFVTHFEEPRNPLQVTPHDRPLNAYYYEEEFMDKWFRTIHEKELRVTQLLLINSDEDIEGLRNRMRVTEEIATYSIAFLLGPPMLVFVDFILVPDDFVLIGFSDNQSMRNLNVFGILIRGGTTVKRFEHMYRNVLLPEAKFAKTFEGVIPENIDWLEEQVRTISRSSSSVMREFFSFRKRNS